jgi:hypothetical protein
MAAMSMLHLLSEHLANVGFSKWSRSEQQSASHVCFMCCAADVAQPLRTSLSSISVMAALRKPSSMPPSREYASACNVALQIRLISVEAKLMT